MATQFTDFVRDSDDAARAEGPNDVAEVEALQSRYRLGRQIAQARLEKGLTQRQLAKLAHVDQGHVSEVERGATNPTLRTLTAMAGAVGLEVYLRPAQAQTAAAANQASPGAARVARFREREGSA